MSHKAISELRAAEAARITVDSNIHALLFNYAETGNEDLIGSIEEAIAMLRAAQEYENTLRFDQYLEGVRRELETIRQTRALKAGIGDLRETLGAKAEAFGSRWEKKA